MQVTNKNMRNAIRWSLIGAGGVALFDLIISQTNTSLAQVFRGYTAIALPALSLGAYAYVGMPIFYFDGKDEVLHIKSHLAFTKLFGKELHIPKSNLVSFEIDRKRLRKKLKVTYLKDGREVSETFSITLLSNTKIEQLAREVKLIHAEVRSGHNFHLFI